MTDLRAVWNAGRVRRWHTNPDLSWTDDYLDGHQGRVARLLLALHPAPSRALIVAALTHDDGEWAVGDIARPAKEDLAEMEPAAWSRMLACEDEARADVWGDALALQPDQVAWLRLCDRLDAHMWMLANKPKLRKRPDWREDRGWIEARAQELGADVAIAIAAVLA